MIRNRGALTGRFRFRRGWFGKMILQVEVSTADVCSHDASTGPAYSLWKDADFNEAYEIQQMAP